nr:uncharacterized protein CTRU02_02710 [Colletotrichum truncatum]KAF6797668.1 hypothetical protein CTRU02_02710 [Colletotrichum truncatum]
MWPEELNGNLTVFDLTELDTLAIDLDLAVLAAEVVQRAVRVHAAQVASSVTTSRIADNSLKKLWIFKEDLFGFGLIAQVATGDRGSLDDYLADCAEGG